ncbi:MAG: DUF3187 family protein [Thermoanaerobaculia bacterium]
MTEHRLAGSGCPASWLALAAWLAVAPGVQAAEFLGPLRVSDEFLLTAGTMTVEPSPLELVAEGSWQAGVSVSIGNTFTRSRSVETALEARTRRSPVDRAFLDRVDLESEVGEPLFFIDGESLRTELRLRRGISEALEIEVRLPVVSLGGGVMDGLLEGFHRVASLDQDGRLGVPRNQSQIFLDLANGDLDLDPDTGATMSDPVIAVRRQQRLREPGHRLLWEAIAKVPVGDEDKLASSGSADLGLQAQWTTCGSRQCRFAAFNLRYLGEWKLLDLSRRLAPGLYAGLERRWGSASWVVQLVVAGTTLEGIQIDDLDSETWQLSGGIHKRFGDRYSMTAALTENVAHFENGPDLRFHWAVRRDF